jgi:hypothetical protein
MPDELVRAVRAARGLPDVPVAEICVLDFDGDLTDWLLRQGSAMDFKPWACFHTKMYLLETDGACCGIIPRTIGGPYAVLIAEQSVYPALMPSSRTELVTITKLGRGNEGEMRPA